MGSIHELANNWLFIILAGSLLAWLLRLVVVRLLHFLVVRLLRRRWLVTSVTACPLLTACPLCGLKPPKLLFTNRCSKCGCQYDQQGTIIEGATTAEQRGDRNRACLAALEDEIAVRQGAAVWKSLEKDYFSTEPKPTPKPRSEHYQPGASQDLTP